jgi:serine protease inhibitor
MKPRYLILCALVCAIPFLWVKSAFADGDLARANNAFAIDLFLRLANSTSNLVVSPFSIDTGLAMAYAGARGQTASQMAKVLRFPSQNASVHPGFLVLLKELNETNVTGCQLEIANSLWAQQGFPFLKPFQELLRDDYNSSLNEIDLTGWPHGFDPAIAAAARKRINDWAAERTRNKITGILPPSLPSEGTRLILVNGISFKGKWAKTFEKEKTFESRFRLVSGETVPISLMHQSGDFRYAETPTLQALELPYVSNRLSMVILLPGENRKLADIEKTLSPALIEQLRQKCKSQEVAIFLPRFKLASDVDLKETLQQMGMGLAFDGGADFSGITPEKPFFIEAALHKACVDVDEEGTEAAAATAISFARGGPPVFKADHPFLFLIRDNKTGIILFLGRVVDPSKQ